MLKSLGILLRYSHAVVTHVVTMGCCVNIINVVTLTQISLQEVTRVLTMSSRLVKAGHPASEFITTRAHKLRDECDKLVGVVEARLALMQLSVSFHDKQNQVC